MLIVGTQLGPYKILAPLGAGGMGEVYRARDARLGRDVAIKVLPDRSAQDDDALARLQVEARALAGLSHPHILTIHELGSDQGVAYLVMEFMEGQTLGDRLDRGSLSWQKALEIGIAIVEGLAAAHSRGVVHRDLKPENVFLTNDGGVKILDFGLAQLDPRSWPQDQKLLETAALADTDEPGLVVGTVPYMSPEQVRGQGVDARSDIFSFGCLLYEMVTGVRPFSYPTAAEIKAAILREDPLALASWGSDLPPDLERVIRHCLEKAPEERFQSARDLAFDLRSILTGSGATRAMPAAPPRRPRRIVWAMAVAGLLATLVLAVLLGAFLARLRGRSQAIDSIAVLPFVNESGDPEADYLSDGVTESIINNLSQLPNVRVIARNSAFKYKGQTVDPSKAGRELGVQAVLTGRVTKRGDMLIVSVELVDVSGDRQLWGERYNRKLADILAVQDDISREITEKLRWHLSGEDKQRLTKRYTDNTEAYQAYLAGRYHWNKRTEEGLKKGIDSFKQALAKDPNYALAYAGLADCYALLGDYGYLRPSEAYPQAKAAAKRAVELDDTLAEAHTSLAFVMVQYDWDWRGAEREFKRALELNANYATAHQWYSEYLTSQGRHDEALAEIKRAQELDPLALITHAVEGRALYFKRQYDQAIEQCRKTLEMDAGFGPAYLFLGRAYLQKRNYDDAIAGFRKAHQRSAGTAILAELGHAYALAGQEAEARKILAELKAQANHRYVTAGRMALLAIALGDKDEAFKFLEQALEERSDVMVTLKVEPRYDSLRADPRFDKLLQRVGLGPRS
jgi:serine/threonine-protein kinase